MLRRLVHFGGTCCPQLEGRPITVQGMPGRWSKFLRTLVYIYMYMYKSIRRHLLEDWEIQRRVPFSAICVPHDSHTENYGVLA
jgi:hypothetical protein